MAENSSQNHATATDKPVPYSTGDSNITDTTIAEMRELAARYPVGRSDEGPTGGKATLAGLRLARERNWTAPGQPSRTDRTQKED